MRRGKSKATVATLAEFLWNGGNEASKTVRRRRKEYNKKKQTLGFTCAWSK